MHSEHNEEFEFIAQVSAEYGIAEDFSIRKPDFVGKYTNIIFCTYQHYTSSLLQSGFGKLLFRIAIFNIE